MDTETMNRQYNHGQFACYDAETMPFSKDNHASHFALTDALITYAGEANQPAIHFWQTSPLVILGMMDTKLGHFDEAYPLFEQYKHDTIVRNSGGLGVISDPGVLNVSLIYPSNKRRLSIDEAYDFMLQFIRDTFYPHFPDKEILAYEISNSYCFGDYDLSIDGQKIAGIAQRRIKNGLAVMLYISVNGDQNKRAKIMREFYAIGRDGSEPAGRYPEVKPEVMTTLEEVYETSLSVPLVKQMMLDQFDWIEGDYPAELNDYYEEGLAKMVRRNERVFGVNQDKDKKK